MEKATIKPKFKSGDSGLNFGQAVEALKVMYSVSREGWNGKGMYLYMIPRHERKFSEFKSRPYIAMKTANDEIVPWVASQTDILENDWVIL